MILAGHLLVLVTLAVVAYVLPRSVALLIDDLRRLAHDPDRKATP